MKYKIIFCFLLLILLNSCSQMKMIRVLPSKLDSWKSQDGAILKYDKSEHALFFTGVTLLDKKNGWIVALILSFSNEIKDCLMPSEKYGMIGGNKFSSIDMIANLVGIGVGQIYNLCMMSKENREIDFEETVWKAKDEIIQHEKNLFYRVETVFNNFVEEDFFQDQKKEKIYLAKFLNFVKKDKSGKEIIDLGNETKIIKLKKEEQVCYFFQKDKKIFIISSKLLLISIGNDKLNFSYSYKKFNKPNKDTFEKMYKEYILAIVKARDLINQINQELYLIKEERILKRYSYNFLKP